MNDAEFLRLYAENEVALRAYVRSMLPSQQEAAEVMQDLIVTLWQKFESAADFRPWAYAVARSKVLMYLRKRSRDRHIFDEELVEKLADRQTELHDRHSTQREALEHCLRKLPDEQREIAPQRVHKRHTNRRTSRATFGNCHGTLTNGFIESDSFCWSACNGL